MGNDRTQRFGFESFMFAVEYDCTGRSGQDASGTDSAVTVDKSSWAMAKTHASLSTVKEATRRWREMFE